jgi:hypothetical protein
MSIELADPRGSHVPHSPTAEGVLIDALRSDCGILLQSVDWLARELGYDLIGSIMDPIAGDFSAVDAMRLDWQAVSHGLGMVARNYDAMAQALPAVWTGGAADAARRRVEKMARAHQVQAEAAFLMSRQLGNMLGAVRDACRLVASLLALVEELLLSFSLAKWAKEVLTMGAGVRRAIVLIDRVITCVRSLGNVVPPMLAAAGLMAEMFRALNTFFLVPASLYTNHEAGSHVDDTADAGFGGRSSRGLAS